MSSLYKNRTKSYTLVRFQTIELDRINRVNYKHLCKEVKNQQQYVSFSPTSTGQHGINTTTSMGYVKKPQDDETNATKMSKFLAYTSPITRGLQLSLRNINLYVSNPSFYRNVNNNNNNNNRKTRYYRSSEILPKRSNRSSFPVAFFRMLLMQIIMS